MSVTDIVPGFDLGARQAAWRRLETGNRFSIVSSHRRKDGTIFPVETRIAAVRFDDRKVMIALATDISERIELDTRLRTSLRQLEEKELAKTRFLAAAGHDLRQPIAAANLFVGALKFTCESGRQQELIGRLEQSMNVFSSLLERLLDISRFDAGLVQPQLSLFNLAELFDWLEQNFEQTALDKGLSFRLFYSLDRSLLVRTDIGLLQSVVMNLVSNAIKFTSRGGILVSARIRDDRVLLQVWDTGCGIADMDLPYIFDEFYQAHNPERNREAGLGLGLSICQRAMSLLGGTVICRSRLGRGSVFELTLPLHIERRQVRHLPQVPTTGKTFDTSLIGNKRVVVLEDDTLVASGLLDLFQGLGAEVLHFATAEEALRHEIGDADFFIVDFALGGKLSGIDFLHAIQRKSAAPVKAAVITGETSTGFMSHTRDLPWPVLHKPASLAQLLSCLQRQS
jgi:signal transduction histidine kinase